MKKKHGKAFVDDLKERAVFLFYTNEKKEMHNVRRFAKVTSDDNPGAIMKCKATSLKYDRAHKGHFNEKHPPACMLCKGANVAIKGRNFCPIWGLHNGAAGIVEETIFLEGKNPNKGDLPEYVVVDFPLYNGPVWDVDNPTVSFYCFYIQSF